jgi:hypothetical protein
VTFLGFFDLPIDEPIAVDLVPKTGISVVGFSVSKASI